MNVAGWRRGLGYCDAQCPKDLRFVQDTGLGGHMWWCLCGCGCEYVASPRFLHLRVLNFPDLLVFFLQFPQLPTCELLYFLGQKSERRSCLSLIRLKQLAIDTWRGFNSQNRYASCCPEMEPWILRAIIHCSAISRAVSTKLRFVCSSFSLFAVPFALLLFWFFSICKKHRIVLVKTHFACCAEDLFEANRFVSALTAHPCKSIKEGKEQRTEKQ